MNSRRLLAALSFALLCSGLLTWQCSRHLVHAAPPAPPLPVRSVVVAAKDMVAGEALTTASLTTVVVPTTEPLMGTFAKTQNLAGRVLTVPVSSGELITAHELADAGVTSGLAGIIPVGMRVVSIPAVDQSAGNSALLAPGNHIDILVSYRSEGESAFVSSVVLQNVPVLANTQKEDVTGKNQLSPVNTVNLLVSPEQAARLTVASSLGKLTFALRNGKDSTWNSGLSHVTLTSSSSARATVASTRARHTAVADQTPGNTFTVETLSGGKSSTQIFHEGQQ